MNREELEETTKQDLETRVREIFCSSEALAVVYVGGMFGVFAAEEVVEALGRGPP